MQLQLPSLAESRPHYSSPSLTPSSRSERVVLRFHRGTLLADGLVYQPDASMEPWRWDPRVATYRAPAHRYLEARRALQRDPWALHDLIARGIGPKLALTAPTLRDYQRQAVDAWLEANRRGLVVLPTGAGKTHVAIAAMAHVGRTTLVLVPTRVLLQQWLQALSTLGDQTIGALGDGQHSLRPLTVATFESANRHMERFGDRFALLIADEVHHLASPQRAEALKLCTAPYRLGLTATPPERFDGQSQLFALMGPLLSRVEMGELCEDHLAPFDIFRHVVRLDNDERRLYSDARERFLASFQAFRLTRGGGDLRTFATAAKQQPSLAAGMGALQASRRIIGGCRAKADHVAALLAEHRRERVLIFVGDNHTAYELSRRLLVPALTCEIRRREREEVLQRLRRGDVNAVISARVLNEGIDLPEARVGIIAGATQGDREHRQRVGRLLRPCAGKRACIYEIVVEDTHEVRAAERRAKSLVPPSTHRR
ncbi:MAG: DEAD/DEAH box helicase family protein [Deltaproteobacteria bacterium]|nr:DEAD/DEAH box helicase family protein [Deltaproteobacteria bacterium]